MKLLKLTSFVFILMLSVGSLQANSNTVANEVSLMIKGDAVLGSWDYFVSGVEPAYAKGIMHITKADGAYAVNVELPGGTIPTEDVEVNDNKITFGLYVEGIRVNVSIVVDGGAFTGSADTSQGAFTMTGTRKK